MAKTGNEEKLKDVTVLIGAAVLFVLLVFVAQVALLWHEGQRLERCTNILSRAITSSDQSCGSDSALDPSTSEATYSKEAS